MKNKKIVLLSVVLLIIGFVIGTMYYQKSVDNKNQEIARENGAPFVRAHSPSVGKNLKKVTIVEFLDPECESCRAFHPAIKKVFSEYKNETRLVIRYLANHGNSKFAIRLLEAARLQNKYGEAMEVVFKYQPQWGNHHNPNPQLLWGFLKEAGLDMKKLRSDFESNNIDELLSLDKEDAYELGVRGTPTFYVNGKVLKSLSYQSLLDLVESEIYK